MAAFGCLLPFVLMIVGAAIGAAFGGTHGGVIGLIAGFVLGGGIAAFMLWGFARIERE